MIRANKREMVTYSNSGSAIHSIRWLLVPGASLAGLVVKGIPIIPPGLSEGFVPWLSLLRKQTEKEASSGNQ